MLISPPFLPERNANESDTDWIERAMKQPPGRMAGTNALEGSFPISAELQWHNGQHIKAPQGADGNALPVRAVADGTVVFVNLITSVNTENQDPNHGQNYLPDKTQSAWTDNGCIILEHTGEIGADGTDTTSFTYYSLYMHLKEIKQVHEPEEKDRKGRVAKAASDRDLKKGDRLYRKDELGRAGKVYGLDNCLHFEIALGKDALATLLGKTWNKPPAWQRDNPADTPTSDGRTDSVFGSVYIYLRANTPASTQAPTAHTRQPSQSSIGQPLWLRIDYDKGQCRYQSFNAQGQPTTPDPVAEAQADYEYNLYTEANKRHNSLSAADQANSSPSGWYELLRFGRNLGSDPLPAQAAHWRQIPGPSGRPMWVDLNAHGSCKFSDADFLPIMGWNCYDDDSNASDQRCDSDKLKARIRAMIEEQDTTLDERTLLRRHLGDEAVQQSMRHAICQFPTEWDSANMQTRYQWQRDPNLPFKLDIEQNWQRFVNHLKAITFDDLPQGYKDAVWHMHPVQFIAHMRKCGWLSTDELSQTFSKYLFYTENSNPRKAITTDNRTYTITKHEAQARVLNFSIFLNNTIRKYLGENKKRIALFLAQVMLETAQWRNLGGTRRLMHEWGFGAFSKANPATQYYTAFYGRGTMQLTWAGNYRSYGEFKKMPNQQGLYHERLTPASPRITQTSKHYSANPADGGTQFVWYPRYDPDIVGEDPLLACDSGGFYWISKTFSRGMNINRACDSNYSTANVGLINRLVNGGGNGYHERQAYSLFMFEILGDAENSNAKIVKIKTPQNDVEVNLTRPS